MVENAKIKKFICDFLSIFKQCVKAKGIFLSWLSKVSNLHISIRHGIFHVSFVYPNSDDNSNNNSADLITARDDLLYFVPSVSMSQTELKTKLKKNMINWFIFSFYKTTQKWGTAQFFSTVEKNEKNGRLRWDSNQGPFINYINSNWEVLGSNPSEGNIIFSFPKFC